jgi:hypothetical protein
MSSTKANHTLETTVASWTVPPHLPHMLFEFPITGHDRYDGR